MLVNILLSLLIFFLWVLWVAGSFLPALPGPQLSYIGILIFYFFFEKTFSFWFLLTWWIIIIVVLVLDYLVPIWGTKKFGGTKYGNRWSILGLILWTMVFPLFWITFWPFGLFSIIWWPFLGAYIWEILFDKDHKKALKSAWWSFVGFLAGTFLKIFVAIWLWVVLMTHLVQYWF